MRIFRAASTALTAGAIIISSFAAVHPQVASASVISVPLRYPYDPPMTWTPKISVASLTAQTVYKVKTGDTLSAIGRKDKVAWQSIYCENKAKIGANPDVIQPGQKLVIPDHKVSCHIVQDVTASVTVPSAPVQAQQPSYSSYNQNVNPGNYSGFQACVISRESGGNSQIMNSSGHYGLYQFSYDTWVAYGGNPADFGHASVAEQNQVFDNAMATPGGAGNWAPYDGC